MSSPNYHNLSDLSKDDLIDIISGLQNNESQQNENILARRNRLLTEENHNFRKQINELNSFRMQYYNLKTSIDHYDTNISELKKINTQLKHENILLNQQLNEKLQFDTNINAKENKINQLQLQNESLHAQIQNYTNDDNKLQQYQFEINQLQNENRNLQEDLLREERLHANKFENVTLKLTEYESKYGDLLQRYSSMESFVEEFCENANFTDESDTAIQQLTKWTQILHHKQENIMNEINEKVSHELNDINNELNNNRYKMCIYEREISHNISKNILNDMICSVVTSSNNKMTNNKLYELQNRKERLLMDEKSIATNKRRMQSQITQLNGQKQIITNLNGTIQSLYAKVKEYEHHIHRLTFQLKQLSLINKASMECNTDFNLQQIKELSHTLMTKEIEFDQLKNKTEIKDNIIKQNNEKLNEFENVYNIKQSEYNEVFEKYNELMGKYKEFNNEYNTLQHGYNENKNKLLNINNAYSEMENENNLLKNKLDLIMNEYNKLKQTEYNYKLLEQELKEKYKINYDKFNQLNMSLQQKIKVLEKNNKCLQNEMEQYHSGMITHTQHTKEVNSKYNNLKYQYEKLQNKIHQMQQQQNTYNTTEPKLQEYENKIKELINQIKIYENELIELKQQKQKQNHNNKNNESLEIQKLNSEIDKLQEQLYVGSNIRRELREFITKYQREGQMKLNKNYTKLTFMKKLTLSTFRVLNEQRQYIDKNDSLRQHLDYLRNTLQENQENNMLNLTDKR